MEVGATNQRLAPVAVFVYKRLDKAQNCIKHLCKCTLANETELHIFSDGYKNEYDKKSVIEVQEWIKDFARSERESTQKLFKSIVLHAKERNIGLANSVISGATELLDQFGKIIVVEDDLVVTRGFLKYMNDALDYYEKDEMIWSIAAYGEDLKTLNFYKHDIYLNFRASSWGWGTWRDRWKTVDWNVSNYSELKESRALQKQLCRGGKDLYPMLQRQMAGELDSWAVRWSYAASMQNKLTVYPKKGYVSNDGFDGSGTHTIGVAPKNNLADDCNVVFGHVGLNQLVAKEFYYVHSDTLWKKIKRNASLHGIFKIVKRFFEGKDK